MLIRRLGKLKQLTSNERFLLAWAVFLLPILNLGLVVLGYYRLRRILEKIIPLKKHEPYLSDSEIIFQAGKIAGVVSIAADHGFIRASCLRKSLMVWTVLRTRGVQSDICFGVRVTNSQLEAHAWVEYMHKVINDSESVIQEYSVLRDEMPATTSGL